MKNKTFKTAVIICTFLLLGGCHYSEEAGRRWDEISLQETATETASGIFFEEIIPAKNYIYVQVCGYVRKPDVYEVSEGTRVFEVLELAGGVTEDGRTDTLWLAKEVQDGDRVYVPGIDEQPDAGSTEDGLVNINTADITGLMTLPGIGEARAGDIISYRLENGGFDVIEDIMKVPGIKEAAFNKIKDRIKVG